MYKNNWKMNIESSCIQMRFVRIQIWRNAGFPWIFFLGPHFINIIDSNSNWRERVCMRKRERERGDWKGGGKERRKSEHSIKMNWTILPYRIIFVSQNTVRPHRDCNGLITENHDRKIIIESNHSKRIFMQINCSYTNDSQEII